MKRDKLQSIRNKVTAISVGLLRFRDGKKQVSLQVNSKYCEDNRVRCYLNGKSDTGGFHNRVVSLVQKQKDDYLYLAGLVEDLQPERGGHIITIRVLKASWFVKRTKGTLSWLQEKFVHEFFEGEQLQMVS